MKTPTTVTAAIGDHAHLAQRWETLPAGWGALAAFRSTGLLVIATLATLAAIAFCRGGKAKHAWPGVVHALVHLSLAVCLAHLLRLVPVEAWPDAAAYWIRLLAATALGGALATLVVGGYLLACASRGVHLNEAFSAQSIEDYKSFLRLHIGEDGDLTVHAVAVPRAAVGTCPRPTTPRRPGSSPSSRFRRTWSSRPSASRGALADDHAHATPVGLGRRYPVPVGTQEHACPGEYRRMTAGNGTYPRSPR